MSLRPQHVDFDSMWGLISGTAHKVIVLEHVPKNEWNDRFHDLYKLCVAFPEPLSERVYNETKKLIETHVKKLHNELAPKQDNELLFEYNQRWTVFKKGVDYLSTLYIYLNSQFVRKYKFSAADVEYGDLDPNEQLMEIAELGCSLWKVHVIQPLQERLVKLLLNSINDDRCGKTHNKQVIFNVITSFVSVENFRPKQKNKLYLEAFEKPFIEATSEYYKQEAKLLLEKNDCSTYMEQVLARLDVEHKRLKEFLQLKDSQSRVIAECEKCMVGEYLEFLQNECRPMVQNESRKDLQNMYKLLKPVEAGLQALVEQFELHIREKGLQVIRGLNQKDENFVANFVGGLLKVHRHHLALINEVFDKDKTFMTALDMACNHVINYRENTKSPCKSPEYLSRYFDSLLKKSTKCYSDQEIEEKMNEAIEIFKYLNDKDVFHKSYGRMLAKRLIYSLYISLDAEESMINKLKAACGYEFTSKLHRMFTDIKVSDDLNSQFAEKLSTDKKDLQISFSVYVLQACAWPLSQVGTPSSVLPPQFERAQKEFEEFYSKKFNGRKLTWLHQLSNGEVKLLFTKKIYTIVMTTYHVLILLQFENVDELSYEELQKQTSLNDEQLQKHLVAFIDSKLLFVDQNMEPIKKINTKNAQEETIFAKNAVFKLNTSFTSRRLKFKLTVPLQKETPQVQQKESEQTLASIEEDRKLFLQAAIVRIMKSRKKMRHNLLMEEVINQAKARFSPSVQMIKKSIESLIEKQYIERVNSAAEEYQYIA